MVKFMASAATAAAIFVGLAVAPADAQSFVNWTRYLFSAQHTSHNGAAKSITPANASKVAQAWRFRPPPAASGLAGFWSRPIVYNGVIYIGARNGRFYAIREKTGAWCGHVSSAT